jgi:hypothetical protein
MDLGLREATTLSESHVPVPLMCGLNQASTTPPQLTMAIRSK